MSMQSQIDATAKLAAFYLLQADKSALEAGETPLKNVRHRHLSSETAWRGMATMTAARVATMRKDAEQAAPMKTSVLVG